jgi:hypothetical protein
MNPLTIEYDDADFATTEASKHMGPGPHPSGSEQDVHAGGQGGTAVEELPSEPFVDEDADNLQDALADVEAEIIAKENEHAFVFDDEGQLVFFKKGDEDSISFTEDERAQFKDKIFTHNHPLGTSISDADIAFAIGNDLREIRAVGKLDGRRMEYRLVRPKDGWHPTMPKSRAYEIIRGADMEAQDELWGKIRRGEISRSQASKMHSNEVVKNFVDAMAFVHTGDPDKIPVYEMRELNE